MEATASKGTWNQRYLQMDAIPREALCKALTDAIYDAMVAIQPVADEVQTKKMDYLRMYAMTEDDTLQTEADLKEEFSDGEDPISDEALNDLLDGYETVAIPSQGGGRQNVVLEDAEAFRAAVDELESEECEIDIPTTVTKAEALKSDLPFSDLMFFHGWLVEPAQNGKVEEETAYEAAREAEV